MNYKPLVNTDLEIADTLLGFFYAAHNNDFLLIGGSEAFGEFLAYMPWGLLIAISWLGFGGLFGLAEIFSKWK